MRLYITIACQVATTLPDGNMTSLFMPAGMDMYIYAMSHNADADSGVETCDFTLVDGTVLLGVPAACIGWECVSAH